MQNKSRFAAALILSAVMVCRADVEAKAAHVTSPAPKPMENSVMTETKLRDFDPRYAHTVFFWLKHPERSEDRAAFETAMQTFLDTSNYAKTGFIGTPPTATREVVDGSFTYSLIVTFESAEAQKSYQQEDAHERFIEAAAPLWSKVIVYDSIGLQH